MMESDTDQGLEIPLSKKRKWGVHNNDKYKRNIIKKARLSGEPYRNYKGAEVPGKVLGKNSCGCHRNCLDKIPKDDQVQMFLELYSIDNKNQQDSFLQGLMEIKAIKRSRPKPGIPAEKTKDIQHFWVCFCSSGHNVDRLKGFEKTGIWQRNKNIFSEADFLPADTTDVREQPITTGTQNKETKPTEPFISSQNTKDLNLHLITEAASSDPIPGCSWMSDAVAGERSSFQVPSPENVLPFPESNSMKRSNRKEGKTAIITESPYKTKLQAQKQKREEKIKAKAERARMKLFKEEKNKDKKDKAQKKQKKRKLHKNRNESKGKKLKKKIQPETDDSSDDKDDAQCLYCGYFYSKSNKGWISCVRCKNWAHNSCANVDGEDDEVVLICKDCHSD
ncbi:hypothetical protein J6590_031265 [Homalodisca vitripennis]|nr:hypothetical protein J6590_031265 [Homalodisca vitripennis]